VTFGVDDPAYPSALVRACAFDVSCAASNGWWSYDHMQGATARSCLADWNPGSFDAVACAPNAGSCDDWMNCASHGRCPSWCAARGLTPDAVNLWTCDGDEVVVCDPTNGNYGVPFEDCAQQAMHCGIGRYGAACTDGTTCTQPSNPHCDGTRVVGCDGSTLFGQSQDCSANGGSCMTLSLGPFGDTGYCAAPVMPPTAAPCDGTTYQPHCDGTFAAVCEFGYVSESNCARPEIDGDCVATAGGVACVPRANACTAATPDACDGNAFVTCGTDQRLSRVDCTTLGFRTCGDIGGRVGCVR